MKQNISKLQNSKGFTGIEILIFIAIISAGFGGVALIFKDVIKEQFKKASVEEVKIEETKPIVNPFPARPSEKSAELPKETSVYRGETGVPIVKPEAQSANASGEWHGRYEVTAPPECAGESAGWQATLNDKNGIITGQFSTDIGVAGSVSGNSEGENGGGWISRRKFFR